MVVAGRCTLNTHGRMCCCCRVASAREKGQTKLSSNNWNSPAQVSKRFQLPAASVAVAVAVVVKALVVVFVWALLAWLVLVFVLL